MQPRQQWSRFPGLQEPQQLSTSWAATKGNRCCFLCWKYENDDSAHCCFRVLKVQAGIWGGGGGLDKQTHAPWPPTPPPCKHTRCFHTHSHWALSEMLCNGQNVDACRLRARLPPRFCLTTCWRAGSGCLAPFSIIPGPSFVENKCHMTHTTLSVHLSGSKRGFLTGSISDSPLIKAHKHNSSCETDHLNASCPPRWSLWFNSVFPYTF